MDGSAENVAHVLRRLDGRVAALESQQRRLAEILLDLSKQPGGAQHAFAVRGDASSFVSGTPAPPGVPPGVPRFCHHCGSRRVPGARFCQMCGANLGGAALNASQGYSDASIGV
eukprot:TRINITY_DN7800_c0_g3_i2.p2 TRINITY_DN7800_c0_g3~~TRINITY_DN7800_c0_g3_i2.p2  ORF type:complete len:114 (+),score=30.37 TRINITY_DN7800_c0_g3_i2:82-423(+)